MRVADVKQVAIAVLCIGTLAGACAQPVQFRDKNGHVLPESPSMRTVNGMGGMLIVTSDKEWRKKWKSPEGNQKTFSSLSTVARGTQIFFLAFFSNPKLDAQGHPNLVCDFDAVKPDGQNAIHHTDLVCFEGALKGQPRNMYLAAPVFNFLPQSSDQLGTYTVHMTIKDKLGNTVLPLTSSFKLE